MTRKDYVAIASALLAVRPGNIGMFTPDHE